ncbi:MAG: hypothetical protein Kow0080_15310 [Candidatus Promineifilaceae bacterium]
MTELSFSPSQVNGFFLDYGPEVEEEITHLQAVIGRFPEIGRTYPSRWLAVKLLEQDRHVQELVMALPGGTAVVTEGQLSCARLTSIFGIEPEILIADRRYTWINALVQQTIHKPTKTTASRSDKIDHIVTHRWFGVPIFLIVMWAVFRLTTDVSAPYLDWIDGVMNGPVARWATAVLSWLHLGNSWIASLVTDGIIAGVGGVLVFVPVLMTLYISLAVLEESGYMARSAFVMDRLMNRIGLHGKSFLPMLVGFGCNVPAIYATRTLENDRDRILTGLLIPFMSCSARLPVYILFAAIFFPAHSGLVVFGLYALGIVTAVLLGIILRHTLFKGEVQSGFIMELPSYRLPTFKGIWQQTWIRTAEFLKNAATVILLVSIIIWALMAVPGRPNSGSFTQVAIEDSLFGRLSEVISPALRPLGFGDPQSTGALITGFVAKEIVISTLTQTYNVQETENPSETTPTFQGDLIELIGSFGQATLDTLRAIPLVVGIDLRPQDSTPEPTQLMNAIRQNFDQTSNGHGTAAGLAFMVFVLIYTPCVATVAAEQQELGAKWMWISLAGQLVLAWLMAFTVFQIGLHLMG